MSPDPRAGTLLRIDVPYDVAQEVDLLVFGFSGEHSREEVAAAALRAGVRHARKSDAGMMALEDELEPEWHQ